ncbi:MAG: efflux RND transporter periplasmic adaptor subunit [Saprospiraceae bacterium]|nr:efflux RND transporter periplasmic adaptor subunit [Saprospiraceae bacterium]
MEIKTISSLHLIKLLIQGLCAAGSLGFITSCNSNHRDFDATGILEADEIVVSAEVQGKLLEYHIREGMQISADSVVGKIDPVQYALQSEQVQQSIEALERKTLPVQPQLDVLAAQELTQNEQLKTAQIQLESAVKEKNRIAKLLQSKAATQKQMDDVTAQHDMLRQQVEVLKSQIQMTRQQMNSYKKTLQRQNEGILSEKNVFEQRKAASDDLLQKAQIRNPIEGVVLNNYVHAGEWVHPGKALYQIADLQTVYLRAYIDGSQLLQVQLNQDVEVTISYGDSERKYPGKLIWISDKAEFTPKTIQTVDERANLVYAIKISIQNDGYLKLGMYAEVKFKS